MAECLFSARARARKSDLISPINAIRIVKAKDINYYPGSGRAVCSITDSQAGRGGDHHPSQHYFLQLHHFYVRPGLDPRDRIRRQWNWDDTGMAVDPLLAGVSPPCRSDRRHRTTSDCKLECFRCTIGT